MNEFDAAKKAGNVLRKLIEENCSTQQEFAYAFGTDLRNLNRWINEGINKISTLQDLAEHFNIDIKDFFPD